MLTQQLHHRNEPVQPLHRPCTAGISPHLRELLPQLGERIHVPHLAEEILDIRLFLSLYGKNLFHQKVVYLKKTGTCIFYVLCSSIVYDLVEPKKNLLHLRRLKESLC